MKKLNKTHLKNRDAIYVDLQLAKSNLDDAVIAYNEKAAELYADAEDKLSEYNDVLERAREWRDEIVEEIDEYVSDRSDKWQESDAAQEIESWKSEFEGLELDELTMEKPEDLEMPNEIDDEVLNNVPEEVNG